MTEKFNLSAERAKNFGLDLEEAYNTMLAFSLENKLDCYPPQDRKKLESVLEFLMDATDMWMNGQIIVSSQERGMDEKKQTTRGRNGSFSNPKERTYYATTGGEIATITGYNSRLVSSAISDLVIRYGVPIIGVRVGIRSGYYIAETKEELLEGLISLKNQVKNEQKRLDVLMSIEDVTAYEKILERS